MSDDEAGPNAFGCMVLATIVVWSFLAGVAVGWWT